MRAVQVHAVQHDARQLGLEFVADEPVGHVQHLVDEVVAGGLGFEKVLQVHLQQDQFVQE